MPGADDDALVVQKTGPQRRTHMRAKIVDCEVFAALKKHGDQPFAQLERSPLTLGNRANFGYGDKVLFAGFGHEENVGIYEVAWAAIVSIALVGDRPHND